MASFPHNFASLAGDQPASFLDDNFNACAFAVDLTALTGVVTALPSSSTPLIPVAGGVAGVSATLSRSDHQHPPQPAAQNLQTGTSYTLAATDDGLVVDIANASAIILTLPNFLPAGLSGLVCQSAAGVITFTAASGATAHQRQSRTATAGQWAVVSWYIKSNSGGTSAVYILSGDMA